MSGVPDRAAFENLYAGKAPWDIGKPQPPFTSVANRVVSPVLDAGCGTGETALYLAGRGHKVTAIDFLEEPIRRAKEKAKGRGANVDFLVKDATTLADWDARFATVIDCGLFHVLSDADRKRYVEGLKHVSKPAALLFLMCFSDEEPPWPDQKGPRRITRAELGDNFADGWEIESIEPVQIEVVPEFAEMTSPGGPKAWFATIRRVA
jgi:cyclopropane fatty-acyl-phospholipid synthase-like methyltransferase